MGCPDETAIALMAEGRLAAAEQAVIERHVDGCPDCRELLATLARAMDVPVSAAGTQALERGDSIGRYVVLDRLGAGGMGIVYSAFDPDLARRVALKLLRDDVLGSVDGEEAHARLRREAQALARLNHPNVVTVYEVATWCGQVYLALEFVDGADLRAWLQQPRSADEIIAVFRRAGEGLAAAHRAGLVHRDFKPGNVLIGSDGRPRVADFGLAQLAGQHAPLPETAFASPSEGHVTRASVVMGTPGYMAPEQVHGGPIDARTDQFAFCVALYEALCGHRPFETSHDHDPVRRMLPQGSATPPRAGVMSTRVWAAIQRGLQLDPARRHPSMDPLLEALAQPRKRATAWIVGLVGAVGVGLTLGIGVFARGEIEPSPAQVEHVQDVVAQARAAADDELYLYPPAADPQATTAYRAVLALERIEDESRDLAATEARGLREEFAGRLVELGADVWDRPGGRAYALDLYAIALVFDPENGPARERASLTPGELALLRSKAAELEFTEAELVSAEPLIALAEPDEKERGKRLRAAVRKRPRKGDLRQLAESMAPPIVAEAAPPKPVVPKPDPAPPTEEPVPEAADSAEVGAVSSERSEPLPQPKASGKEINALIKKGDAARKRGDFDGAAAFYRQALNQRRNSPAALNGLSVTAFDTKDNDRAIDYARRATKLAPRNASYRLQLGDALYADMRYREAKAAYEEAAARGHPKAKARIARVDKKLGS